MVMCKMQIVINEDTAFLLITIIVRLVSLADVYAYPKMSRDNRG